MQTALSLSEDPASPGDYPISLTVDATVAAGAYPITVRASDGAVVRTQTFTLSVATYSFTVSDKNFSLALGGTRRLAITITSAGVTGELKVNLVPTGKPSDQAALKAMLASGELTVGPAVVTIDADGQVTRAITVSAGPGAAAGSYRFKFELERDGIRVRQGGGFERMTITR